MTAMTGSRLLALAVAGAACYGLSTEPAMAEVEIKGRISALIGTTPGGGTDGTTRLVGRFLVKHLPGSPQIIYRNMPSGGGLQATNYLATMAKPDGSIWMGGDGDYIDAESVANDLAKFDPRQFMFIGGVARGGTVMLLNKAKMASLLDRSQPPVAIGSQDGSGSLVGISLWGAETAGWNLRFVIGYPSTGASVLAMRRGELDGFGTSDSPVLDPLIKTGQFVGIAQEGQVSEAGIVRRASYPDVPTVDSIVAGKLSGVALRAYEAWSSENQVDKWFALPPNTPADIVKTYRAAFAKAIKDPDFLKFAKHQFSADLSFQTGDELRRLVTVSAYPGPEVHAYNTALRAKYQLPVKPLSDAELAELAKKLVKFETVSAVIEKVEREGRVIHFKVGAESQNVSVSGTRTEVRIGGKEAKRSAVAPGMTCSITHTGSGSQAQKVEC